MAAAPTDARTPTDIEQIVRFLQDHSLTLVTAESCTAGLIASNVADVEGAGELLDCAFVTYSPSAKQKCLGVDPKTIEKFNLTSEEVAREMALGALNSGNANLAVSNTGVTDSVDPKVPSGTQCYAWVFVDRAGVRTTFSETRRFSGDRNQIRRDSAAYALSRIPDLHRRIAARAAVA
jgi:nicotinamide-nucleotide amidase